MKVLIVDDDPRTIQLIEDTVPWSDYGISEVYTAWHGEMALKLIWEHHPEIVISDIEMPQMDGIRMLEKLREEGGSAPEVIFLTCHDEFSYAQKALRYGAVDYLLKPFQAEELLAVLLQVVTRCKKKEGKNSSEEIIDAHTKDSTQNFMYLLFNKMIDENEKELKKTIKDRKLPFSTEERYYLIYAGCSQERIGHLERLTEGEFYFIFKNLATEIIGDNINDAPAAPNQSPPYFTLILPVSEKDCSKKLIRERCERLIRVCEKYLEITVFCLISEPVPIREFCVKKQEMDKVFSENRADRGDVRFLSEMKKEQTGQGTGVDLKKVETYIHDRQKAGFIVYLKLKMAEYDKISRLSLELMQTIQHDLIQIFYGCLYENHIQANLLFQDETFRLLSMRATDSSMDMIRYASYLYDRTIDQIEQILSSDSVIGKAKRFIDQNYQRNIGRDAIAASICVAPTYLSKIFREQVGMSLREYINSCRIDHAKKLLADTNDTVSDIAIEVGFENIPYFSTIFKKYCHMTPFAWRSQVKGEQGGKEHVVY